MVGGSLRVLRLPPPQKTGRHDIAEIVLKVALIYQKSHSNSKGDSWDNNYRIPKSINQFP